MTGSAYAYTCKARVFAIGSGHEYVLKEHCPDVRAYIDDGTVQGALLEYPLLLEDICKQVREYGRT